jgi:hypothetical protein
LVSVWLLVWQMISQLRLPVYAVSRRWPRRVVTIRSHPTRVGEYDCFDTRTHVDLKTLGSDFCVQLNPVNYANLWRPRSSVVPVALFLSHVRRGSGDVLVVKPSADTDPDAQNFTWKPHPARRAFTTILPTTGMSGTVSSSSSSSSSSNSSSGAATTTIVPLEHENPQKRRRVVATRPPPDHGAGRESATSSAPVAAATADTQVACACCEEEKPPDAIASGLCANPAHAACKTCVTEYYFQCGKLPQCMSPDCQTRCVPDADKIVQIFRDAKRWSPELESNIRRLVLIHIQHHFAPCPATGQLGKISADGSVVRWPGADPDPQSADAQRGFVPCRCYRCLGWKTKPEAFCGCANVPVKSESMINPFFRFIKGEGVPQAFGLARNFQIDDYRMRLFLHFLIVKCKSAVPAMCPGCSTLLHKSAACNELTCPTCGVHMCYFCGHAEKGLALIDHFGPCGCPRFDTHAALTHNNRVVHIRCPCTPACQNEKHDCTSDHPHHKTWRSLMVRNRQQNWITGFIRSLDPDRQKKAWELLRTEFKPLAGSFSSRFVSSNGHARIPSTAGE